jgi:hypothetical protein
MPDNFWGIKTKERRERLVALVGNQKYDEILDRGFMEGVAARRARLLVSDERKRVILITALLLLACALLVPDAKLSFLGVQIDAKSFREILLVISASVSASMYFDWGAEIYSRELLGAYVRKVGKTDADLKRALRMRFELAVGTEIPRIELAAMTAKNKLLFFFFGLSFLSYIVFLLVGSTCLHIWAIVSILKQPTISETISVLIAIYVVIADIMSVATQTMTGSLVPDE